MAALIQPSSKNYTSFEGFVRSGQSDKGSSPGVGGSALTSSRRQRDLGDQVRRGDFEWVWSNRPRFIAQMVVLGLSIFGAIYLGLHGHSKVFLLFAVLFPAFFILNVVNRTALEFESLILDHVATP